MSNDLSIVRDVLGEELSPDSIDAAVRNAATVIPRLVREWYPNAHRDEWPARRPGELSYFIPESAWRSDDRGGEVSLVYERGLTALLYVHRIVINSPLLMLSSASMRGKSLEWCRDLLLTGLHLLSSLKDFIDAGIVVLVGSDANYGYTMDTSIEGIGRPAFDEIDFRLRQIINFSLNSECAVDIFANSDAEYLQLKKIFGGDGGYGLASPSDAVHFSALEEVVADAANLDLGEVLRIRQGDMFEEWRTGLRAAIRQMILVNSTASLEGEGLEEMRELLREKAARISEGIAASSSLRTKLRNYAASFAVAGIGAMSMAPIVSQAAAVSEVEMQAGALGIGVLSAGLAAVARSLRSQDAGKQALAYHYAFVAKCAKR